MQVDGYKDESGNIVSWNKPVKVVHAAHNFEESQDANERKMTRATFRGLTISDRTITKLKSVWKRSASVIAGNDVDLVFQGNSPYDSGGGQPNGFDQWAQFYNTYMISASKIKVKVTTTANLGSQDPLLIVVVPSTLPTLTTYQIDAYSTMKYAKVNFQILNNNIDTTTAYMTTAKINGKSKKAINDEITYSGDIPSAAHPPRRWYWHVILGGINQFFNSYSYVVYVELIHYVTFYNRKYFVDT